MFYFITFFMSPLHLQRLLDLTESFRLSKMVDYYFSKLEQQLLLTLYVIGNYDV